MRRKKIPRALKWSAGVLAGLLFVLVLFLAFFDWNRLRQPIARFVGQRIEREVQIAKLDVRLLSRSPHVIVEGLRIGNPQWAGGGDMVDVGHIAVDFKWPRFLIGHFTVRRVQIADPDVKLFRQASGQANWQFGRRAQKGRPVGSEPLDLPVIRQFVLSGGRVEITDGLRKLRFDGAVEAAESADSGEAFPFKLIGRGSLNHQPFELALKGGPLVNVERDKPYPIDADVTAGTSSMSVRGSIARPFDLGHFQGELAASGNDLAALYYLTGLALPNTPPYKVTSHLRRDGTKFSASNFSGTVGDSDIHGDLAIETGSGRPVLTGDLLSKALDLDDLAAPLGAAPQGDGAETISPEQRAKGKEMASRGRLFPDATLQMERIRGMDADVKFHAETVKTRKIPMRQVAFHIKLKEGLLTADPVSFVLPQGRFEGSVKLDARSEVATSDVDFRMSGLKLDQFKSKDGRPPLEGTLIGRVQLKGRGNSVSQVVADANGSVTAIVPDGEIREAFAELTGINVARGLGLLLTKDQQQVRVRCGVADFELKGGKLSARNLVFDTENVLITGSGHLDLSNEQADLEIKGQPKKLRFLRIRAPISIKGPLRKPQIGVEGEDLARQTGAAAVLSAIAAPIAAVIAFVDPGLAKDANCSALLAEAERDQDKPIPAPPPASRR